MGSFRSRVESVVSELFDNFIEIDLDEIVNRELSNSTFERTILDWLSTNLDAIVEEVMGDTLDERVREIVEEKMRELTEED